MSKDNKLIIKNSGILFLRLLITSVIGLFSSRLIIQGLGASDFGLYNVVGGVVIMMAFLNTVMTSTTYRFIAFEMGRNNNEGVNEVFNVSVIIHLCLAVLLTIFTETLGVFYIKNYLNVETGKILDAIFVLRFSTYSTFFSILSIPFQGLVTAKERFTTQAIIEFIRSVLAFLVALLTYNFLGDKLRLYAILVAVTSIIPAILFYFYCYSKFKEIIHWNFQKNMGKYKEMISFSGWIMLGAGASVGQKTGSALIINSFFSTVLNAAFGIANQINSIITMFARNLSQAAIPQITKSFSCGDTNRTLTLTASISKYTFFLMLFPSLPILLETEYLLNIWLIKVPPFTSVFCKLIIMATLVNSLGSGLPALVQASGKIKYFQIILSATSIMGLPVSIILFRIGFSPSSILVINTITETINLLLWQILLKYITGINVDFFIRTVYFRALFVTITLVPLFLIRDFLNIGLERFLFISVFSVIWVLFSIYILGMEKSEKEIAKQMILNFICTKLKWKNSHQL